MYIKKVFFNHIDAIFILKFTFQIRINFTFTHKINCAIREKTFCLLWLNIIQIPLKHPIQTMQNRKLQGHQHYIF